MTRLHGHVCECCNRNSESNLDRVEVLNICYELFHRIILDQGVLTSSSESKLMN